MTSWSAINARQEEAAIAIGVYKLAVRISIGSGCFGAVWLNYHVWKHGRWQW